MDEFFNSIKKVKLTDGIERSILDSEEKIKELVKKRYNEDQKEIDLSNVIIIMNKGENFFTPNLLCDALPGVCHFENDKYSIEKQINFDNSIIYGLQFLTAIFKESVSFKNTLFYSCIDFRNSVFEKEVYFTQINFNVQPKNEDAQYTPLVSGRVDFSYIEFKSEVIFNVLIWENISNIHFCNNTYHKSVEFQQCSISNQNGSFYDFSDSTFYDTVIIDGRTRMGIGEEKISGIDFSNSHFLKKIKIWGVVIGNIAMINCHFNDTVNLSYNRYDENSRLDFTYATIKSLFFIDSDLGGLVAGPMKLGKEIVFHKSLISNDAFIFLRNFNTEKGELDFTYSNILGTLTIQDSVFKTIKLNKSTIVGNINIENVRTNYDCWESITKIKNGFIKKSDTINALMYKSKEIKKYREYLKKEGWRKFGDRIILWLNTFSNNNGTNPWRGIFFTLSASFIFYSLYQLSINQITLSFDMKNSILFDGDYWKHVLSFLWLPNTDGFNSLLKDKNSTFLSFLSFIIGKIIVAYGIYQTIVGFRKYGK